MDQNLSASQLIPGIIIFVESAALDFYIAWFTLNKPWLQRIDLREEAKMKWNV